MKLLLNILLMMSLVISAQAQSGYRRHFPVQGASLQYAGSVGFLSAGYHVRNEKEKVELGLIYGFTPERFGGPLHSASFKFTYIPFQLPFLEQVRWEPVQAGFFIAKNFGHNLYFAWPEKYPQHYYWWPNSVREHIFLSTQLSYEVNAGHLKKISGYFEANTNDLYLASYLPNRRSLRLYDIIFFGAGLKADFR